VNRFEFVVIDENMDFKLVHDEAVCWSCHKYGKLFKVYNNSPERVWRHLDIFQLNHYFNARIPRFIVWFMG